MSSAGQLAGGLVGGVIGFFTGGAAGAFRGAQLGMMVGGIIDPPKLPSVTGPRIQDLSVQTSTYGAFIPRVYGTVAITGNIIWLKGGKLTEVKTTTTSGGKGAPEQSSTTYSYFATFALALCEGPIDGIRRIWINGNLWYDAGSADFDAIIASNNTQEKFTLYTGTDIQNPDPLIQADRGVNDVPAYRGISYLVFEGLPLADYGNSLQSAQVRVEVMSAAAIVTSPTTIWARHLNPASNPWTPSPWSGIGVGKPLTKNIEGVLFYTRGHQNYGSPTHKIVSIKHTLYSSIQSVVTYADNPEYFPPVSGTATEGPYRAEGDFTFAVCNSDRSMMVIDTVQYATGFSLNSVWMVCQTERLVFITAQHNSQSLGGLAIFYKGGQRISTKTFSRFTDGYTASIVDVIDYENNRWLMWVGRNVESYSLEDGSYIETIVAPEAITEDSCVEGGYLWTIFSSSGFQGFKKYDLTTFAEIGNSISLPSLGGSAGITAWKQGDLLVRTLAVTTHNADIVRISSISPSLAALSGIVQAECLKSKYVEVTDLDVSELTDEVRGYRVTSRSAIKAGIEPLRGVFPFDVVQQGYKIKFKKRGSASVATIEGVKLDAREEGTSPGVEVTNAREQDTLLPRQVKVHYLDGTREYDMSEQIAVRGL